MGSNLSKEPATMSKDQAPEGVFPLGQLPTNVLEQVLMNIDASRRTLLGYRLVNHRWKEAVNTILEKKVLSRDWKPFPKLNSVSRSLTLKGKISCHSPAMMGAIGSPFPSSSLVLTGKQPKRKRDEEDNPSGQEMELFFGNSGEFLTTFSLQNISISFEALLVALGSMESLKFLKMSNVTIAEQNKMVGNLPALLQLKMLQVEFSNFAAKPLNERRKLRTFQAWLVAKYSPQLEILVLKGGVQLPQLRQEYLDQEPKFMMETSVIAYLPGGAFGKLKELKVYRPCRKFLQLKFPSLQRLSVEGLDGGKHVDILDVAGLLEECGERLIHAHLDIPWADLLEKDYYLKDVNGKELGKEFKLECLRDEAIINHGKLRIFTGKKLGMLKSLGLHVPKDDVEAAVIKMNFLEKMPSLEKVELIQFEKVAGKRGVEQEGSGKEKQVKGFIEKENYWGVCEKLRVVSVSSGPEPSGDVYEEHRKIPATAGGS